MRSRSDSDAGSGKSMLRQKSGRVINITSTAGAMGNPVQVNDSAAKAGVIGDGAAYVTGQTIDVNGGLYM